MTLSSKLIHVLHMTFRYNTRHVALKIVYLGWDYQGFAVQEDSNKTIEHALFEALTRTKLIESRYNYMYTTLDISSVDIYCTSFLGHVILWF